MAAIEVALRSLDGDTGAVRPARVATRRRRDPRLQLHGEAVGHLKPDAHGLRRTPAPVPRLEGDACLEGEACPEQAPVGDSRGAIGRLSAIAPAAGRRGR